MWVNGLGGSGFICLNSDRIKEFYQLTFKLTCSTSLFPKNSKPSTHSIFAYLFGSTRLTELDQIPVKWNTVFLHFP